MSGPSRRHFSRCVKAARSCSSAFRMPGPDLPPDLAARLTKPGGRCRIPTGTWIGFTISLPDLDVTVLAATHSRIVVDLNRGPEGANLYPGQAETGLCPTESFAGTRSTLAIRRMPRRSANDGRQLLAALPRPRCRRADAIARRGTVCICWMAIPSHGACPGCSMARCRT